MAKDTFRNKLTDLEQHALDGLGPYQQLLQQEVQKFNDKRNAVWNAIEDSIGLTKGSIGATHYIENGEVKLKQVESQVADEVKTTVDKTRGRKSKPEDPVVEKKNDDIPF